MAGTGKSTIARTIAREYYEKRCLGASFFFSRGSGDLGSASKVFTTIARQLVELSPDLERYIYEAVAKTSNIGNLGLQDQWEKLIVQPLSRLEERTFPLPLVLVIDALDECEGDDDVELLLRVLATAGSLHRVQLRILVTSRPEISIRHGIFDIPTASHQDFILHNIEQTVVDHDISVFFEHNLKRIRRKFNLALGWPGEDSTRLLVQRAGGLFIYAATARRFIGEDPRLAEARLDLILQCSNPALPPEKQLDKIYSTILDYTINKIYDDQERKNLHAHFSNIVGSIVVLFDTLSVSSLAKLLDTPGEKIYQTLTHLHSILHVPEDGADFIRLLHPSFRDFLLDVERCPNPQLLINKEQAHYNLLVHCLRVMMSHPLRRDLCQLRAPGARSSMVDKSEVDKCIPLQVQYACRYWVHHLQQCNLNRVNFSNVDEFLQTHILHWLEGLALMGCRSEGILMVKALNAMFPVSGFIALL